MELAGAKISANDRPAGLQNCKQEERTPKDVIRALFLCICIVNFLFFLVRM